MLNIRKFLTGLGIVPSSGSNTTLAGEMQVQSDDSNRLKYNNGSSASGVLTISHAAQGTNRVQNKDLEDSSTQIVDSSDTTKAIKFDAAGSTNTATTVTSSQTANRTLTLPDATDTLVGKATTDTLTNKTLSGNTATNLVSGSGTFTFNTSGTITAPNATDTLVGRATTDEGASRLQNKDLSNANVQFVDPSDTSKKLNFSTSGATASTTMTLSSSQSTNQTLSLPDATDTVAVLAATQSFSNKSLVDNSVAVVDNSDATKKIKFDAGGTTNTATTLQGAQTSNRTLTLPDATDTLVGRATTDTLTNKTIAFASNTFSGALGISNGGTGQTAKAAAFDALSPMTTGGDIIYGGASGTATRLANGTSGQVLTSSGTTAAPTWTTLTTVTPVAPTRQIFTSGSGTYTTPTSPSPLYLKVTLTGGGGGGASGLQGGVLSGGSGGGAGGTAILYINSPSSTYSYAVGTGGTGGAGGSSNASGNDGVDTTFSTAIAAKGKGATSSQAGSGGQASFGTLNIAGGDGGSGGNGVPGTNTGGGGSGGDSFWGGGGSGGNQGTNSGGSAGEAYGSGGGGGAGAVGSVGGGGQGFGGIIFVEEFYQ